MNPELAVGANKAFDIDLDNKEVDFGFELGLEQPLGVADGQCALCSEHPQLHLNIGVNYEGFRVDGFTVDRLRAGTGVDLEREITLDRDDGDAHFGLELDESHEVGRVAKADARATRYGDVAKAAQLQVSVDRDLNLKLFFLSVFVILDDDDELDIAN